jgi:FkbM family methyltransferase
MTNGMTNSVMYRILFRMRPALLASALKSVLCIRRGPVAVDEGRFHIDPVSHFGQSLLTGGTYEPELTASIKRLLPAGGVFVDLGANEGWFSVVAAKAVGPNGRVIAIEPQSRLRAILEANFQLNRLRNVTLSQVAVGGSEGEATFHLSSNVNTGSSGMVRTTKYPVPTETARVVTLEHLMDSLSVARVDCLKMDIEGSEWDVVMGSPRFFEQRRVRHLFLELHPAILARRGRDVGELTGFLEKCGYRRVPDLPVVCFSVREGRG